MQRGLVLGSVIKAMSYFLLAALLIYVLWPITNYERRARPRVECLSQVKQMDLAVVMYSNDFDEWMPRASSWIDSTLPYIKDEAVYHDPEVGEPTTYGYAFRDKASLIKLSKVKDPASFPVIFDSIIVARNAHSELETLPNPGRHNGLNSIGYLDGHAKSVRVPEVK